MPRPTGRRNRDDTAPDPNPVPLGVAADELHQAVAGLADDLHRIVTAPMFTDRQKAAAALSRMASARDATGGVGHLVRMLVRAADADGMAHREIAHNLRVTPQTVNRWVQSPGAAASGEGADRG